MLAVAAEPYESDASRVPEHILRHKHSQKLAQQCWAQQLEQQSIDTEAGMLSGISQKHNMRSSPCRFTEFCNSQCLSHFAAPFIADRTETSIAESCKCRSITLELQQKAKGRESRTVAGESSNTEKHCNFHLLPLSSHLHADEAHRRMHRCLNGMCE